MPSPTTPRPTMSRLSIIGILLLAPCLLAVAMAQAQITPRTVNVGIVWDPITFDPHVATSSETVIIDNLYEPLVYYREDSTEIVPWLAESWEVGEDGTVYTFRLRQGVRFHDGSELDAATVVANFERVLRLKTGPFWTLEALEAIEAVDPLTVRLSYRPGGPPVLQSLPLVKIVSGQALRDHAAQDDAQAYLAEQVAGSGAYQLRQLQRGDRVLLSHFPDYWQGWTEGQFTEANLLIIPEASSQALMIEGGDLDIAFRVPAENIQQLDGLPTVDIVRAPGNNALYLRFNAVAGPTADPRVRQALAHSFDAEGFILAMGGTYEPLSGYVPPQFLGGVELAWPYALDTARATSLL